LKDLVINAHQMDNTLKYKKKVSLWESKMLFWYIPAAFFLRIRESTNKAFFTTTSWGF
jgi:hypothetical protein